MSVLIVKRSATAGDFIPASGFSVTGDAIDGEIITVSGASVGTKPGGAGPLYFYDFGKSGTTTLHAASRGTYSGGFEHSTIVESQVAPNRQHSLEYAYQGTSQSAMAGPFVVDTEDRMQYWSRQRFNFAGDEAFAAGSLFNNKFWRIWSGFSGFGVSDYIFEAVGGDTGPDGNPRSNSEAPGSGTWNVGGNFGLHKNEWRTKHGRLLHGTVNNADTSVTIGDQGFELANVNNPFVAYDGASPSKYRRFFFPQEQSAWALTSFRLNIDAVYVDDEWMSFWLTDTTSWETDDQHNQEVQIPLTWSGNVATLEFRAGIFGAALSGKCLYMRASSGAVSKVATIT
jgi:hypothetical protein